jgi:hypothetical protein
MQRLSNRLVSERSHSAPQVQHIDRVVEVPVHTTSIEFRDKEVFVDRIVEVPVEKIVEVEKLTEVSSKVDESYIQLRINELNTDIMLVHHDHKEWTDQRFDSVKTALDMQSRALVALKAQRDIDRDRRLMLIKRIKKEKTEQKVINKKLKIAIAVSIVLPLLLLFIKL